MKSINWINAVKALCVIFVFLRHSENYYGVHLGFFDSFFLTFYVNAFFFISGYLLFWKQLSEPRILENTEQYATGGGKTQLFNILFRIIIPSVIFSIIEFFPSCIIQGRVINISYALYKTIGGGTYWFTSALAVAELILLALFCSRRRNIWFYVGICFSLGTIGLVIVRLGFLHSGLWAWRQGLIALIFLALGGLYWRYEKYIDRLMKWWFVAPLLLVYVVLVIGLKDYSNPLVSTLSIQPMGFITSAMACLLLVWLCKQFPEMKPLTFIGQNSIGFYFTSGALPITYSMITHKMFPDNHVWLLLVIWVACLLTAFFAVKIINRYLPWLWDLRIIRK